MNIQEQCFTAEIHELFQILVYTLQTVAAQESNMFPFPSYAFLQISLGSMKEFGSPKNSMTELRL